VPTVDNLRRLIRADGVEIKGGGLRVTIKDSAEGWVRGKPLRRMLFIVVAGIVLGGVVGTAAGYKIEQNRTSSGVNHLKAQITRAHSIPTATTKPGAKSLVLPAERAGTVTVVRANAITLATKRLGVLRILTTTATQVEDVGGGSKADVKVGGRAIVTIGGDVLLLSGKSLLGRPITNVTSDSFAVAKVNGTGTTTIMFSKVKVIDSVSGAQLSDIKKGSNVLVGGHAPTNGDFTAVEVIVLPPGSGFAR
jgi:hypothetical protein